MYRTIDCATWDDPWFADLDPQAKLLFLYFLTNRRSTAAGCFEITLRAMAFETGMSTADVTRHLGELSSRIQWFPDHQVIFVRNFYRHQSGNSNKTNFRASALKVLAEMPVEVQTTVAHVYPELATEEVTHPQPIPNPSPTLGDKEEETVEVEVEVTEAAEEEEDKPARVRVPSKSEPFEALVALCEATGADVSDLSGSVKSRQGNKAKQLLADGMTVADIGRLAGYCASQLWRSEPVDMFTVERERSKWELAGKPAQAKPASNGRASPRMTNEELSVAAIRRAAGKQAPEPSGPVFETTGRIQR